jgi:Fe-S-cluster-containing dehydrogenase component
LIILGSQGARPCGRYSLFLKEEEVERNSGRQVLIFDAEKCTGCCICELTCSMAKHGEYNPKKSYIRLLKNWEMDVSIAALDLHCDACQQCVNWCPAKAIRFQSAAEAAVLRKKSPMGVFPAPFMSRDKEMKE